MDVAANVEQHVDEIERVCPPGLDEGVKIQKTSRFWCRLQLGGSGGVFVHVGFLWTPAGIKLCTVLVQCVSMLATEIETSLAAVQTLQNKMSCRKA